MSRHFVSRRSAGASAAAVAVLLATAGAAHAVARTPTISGNGWVGLLIIGVLVGTLYMLIMGALHVERRDARLGRARRNSGWYGIFPAQSPDEEDAPDFHHPHDGGDGGDGGEGGGS